MKTSKPPTVRKQRISRKEQIAHIKILITTIEERSSVISPQTLKRMLGSEAWSRFKISANLSIGGPTRKSDIGSLAPYVAAVREADRRYRVDSINPPAMYGVKLMKRGIGWVTWEGAYERAYELLEEILADEPGLQCYFDRDIRFGQDGNLDVGPDEAPRLKNSRSPHVRGRVEAEMDCALLALQKRLKQLEELELAKNAKRPARPRKDKVPATQPTVEGNSRWWANGTNSMTPEQLDAYWMRKS